MNNRSEVVRFETALADLWTLLDELFAGFSPADWQQPHGPDWVFADLPYHLGYVDRLTTAEPLRLGADIPVDLQLSLPAPADLNAWNDAQFARRAPGFTVAQSLAEMRAGRELISREMAAMHDLSLGRPVWFSLLHMRGWRPAVVPLLFCAMHTWGHLEEARLHLGIPADRLVPVSRPWMFAVRLEFMHDTFLDRAAAADADMQLLTVIDGPGGGEWTTHIQGGRARVTPGAPDSPDLTFRMAVDAFIRFGFFLTGMRRLIGRGEVQVSDLAALQRFAAYYPRIDMSAALPESERPRPALSAEATQP